MSCSPLTPLDKSDCSSNNGSVDTSRLQPLSESLVQQHLLPASVDNGKPMAPEKVGSVQEMPDIADLVCAVERGVKKVWGRQVPWASLNPNQQFNRENIPLRLISEAKHVELDPRQQDEASLLYLTKSPHIESLSVWSNFSQPVWAAFANVSNVRHLQLYFPSIDAQTIGSLAAFKQLESLKLSGVAEETVIVLLQTLHQHGVCLQHLDLEGCRDVTDRTIRVLEKCYPNLRILNLAKTAVTDETINPRSPFWSSTLDLSGCYQICPLPISECPPNVTMLNCGFKIVPVPFRGGIICDEEGSGASRFSRVEFYYYDEITHQRYTSGKAITNYYNYDPKWLVSAGCYIGTKF